MKKEDIYTIPPLHRGLWSTAEHFFTIKKICCGYTVLRKSKRDRLHLVFFFFSTNWPSWKRMSVVVGWKQPIAKWIGGNTVLWGFQSHLQLSLSGLQKSHFANLPFLSLSLSSLVPQPTNWSPHGTNLPISNGIIDSVSNLLCLRWFTKKKRDVFSSSLRDFLSSSLWSEKRQSSSRSRPVQYSPDVAANSRRHPDRTRWPATTSSA